jgi:hypothetical protein
VASGPAYILGISCYYHDAAAALIRDGEIFAAAQEERFTRVKHDAGFPSHAVRYCLQEAGIVASDLTAVVFYDKPLLKFERILETALAYAPRGLRSFLTATPVWLKEKLWIPSRIRSELDYDGLLLFADHHECRDPHHGWRGRMDHHELREGRGEPHHPDGRSPFPAFPRAPVLSVHLLHRVQSELGGVQGDGTGPVW